MSEGRDRWRELLIAWLQWELFGLIVFFAIYDWSDVIAMSCALIDPEGEVYVDCDPASKP